MCGCCSSARSRMRSLACPTTNSGRSVCWRFSAGAGRRVERRCQAGVDRNRPEPAPATRPRRSQCNGGCDPICRCAAGTTRIAAVDCLESGGRRVSVCLRQRRRGADGAATRAHDRAGDPIVSWVHRDRGWRRSSRWRVFRSPSPRWQWRPFCGSASWPCCPPRPRSWKAASLSASTGPARADDGGLTLCGWVLVGAFPRRRRRLAATSPRLIWRPAAW